MNDDEVRKLRGYQRGLEGQLETLSDQHVIRDGYVSSGTYRLFIDEVQRARAAFPEHMPTCRDEDFYAHRTNEGNDYYHVTPMRQYLAMAVGKLRAAVEEVESIPITERREFPFVKESELRKILARDYDEIQRAYLGKCWKSVIILSGGAIETILVDLLLQSQAKAATARSAPANKPDVRDWGLKSLIDVSVELGLVSAGVEKLSNPVREYRNLIHPGNEIQSKLTFGAEEAKIALEVLHIVHRDLS